MVNYFIKGFFMMKRKHHLLALLLFLHCLFNQPVEATEIQSDYNNQVIVISFDGMRNDFAMSYAKEGVMPNLSNMIQNGIRSEYAKTIFPSLTAPSHAAISTGTRPVQTGMVSNQWQSSNPSSYAEKNGFSEKFDVNPLWVEAKKQGKTTATVAFTGTNPDADQQGDYTVYPGGTLAESQLVELTFQKAKGWKGLPKSYSPLKEAAFTIAIKKEGSRKFHIVAFDSSNDGKTDYDSFILSEDKVIDGQDTSVNGDEWGHLSLAIPKQTLAGFAFKLKSTNLDKPVKLYHTDVTAGFVDGPAGFADTIESTYGYFPMQSDVQAFKDGWITRKEYEEISTYFNGWITELSLFIKEHYKPDLLMFYSPLPDEEQHNFLLSDPRQPGFAEEKSETYMGYVEWAYQLADEMIGQTREALDENDHLFILSDHGMEPVHSSLEPNKWLLDAGLLTLDEKGKIDTDKSKVYAVPSGTIAHIYINEAEKEDEIKELITTIFKEAVITQKTDGSVIYSSQSKVKKFFTSDWWSGLIFGMENLNPFEIVDSKNEKGQITMHPNSGEIIIVAAPGFTMGNGVEHLVAPTKVLGNHGGDPARAELHAVFIAEGPSFQKNKEIPSISTLDIAPTIYELLGLRSPSVSEGKSKFDVMLKK
jgi:predicted AlkP superfamily pyrophosphatase or phosphodiesterase